MARKFFYDTGEEKVGPVTGAQLVRLRALGEISDDTWVRRADSSTWRPLAATDLRKEEAAEAHPSLWRLLFRTLSWRTILSGIAALIIFVTLISGLLYVAWPVFLFIAALCLLSRLTRL